MQKIFTQITLRKILTEMLNRFKFCIVRAFKVYVRPMLEYASCVWLPHLIKRRETNRICSAETIHQLSP
jgi:hypothetical protein